MIIQRDDEVTIQGRALIGAVYHSVLLGIARRRHDGVPSLDLQQLAQSLFRAYMSPTRHELPTGTDTPADWNSQDGGLIGSADTAPRISTPGTTVNTPAAPWGVARDAGAAGAA